MTTRRENLLTLLRGGRPQWTPCTINLSQWFDHHQTFHSLPDELKNAQNHLEALRHLGCDIFSRNLDGGWRAEYQGVEQEHRTEPGQEGPTHIRIVHTPFGDLRHIQASQSKQSTSYAVEDLVKNWEQDGDAILWMTQRLRCHWDAQTFEAIDDRIGDDGLVLLPVTGTPMKMVHQTFGLDGACLFLMDHPQAAKKLCDLYWQACLPALEQIAAHPRVAAICLMDNVDTPFYPPSLCADFWTPYVRQAVRIMRPKGKRVFAHACGHLHGLLDVIREAQIDGLEGMPHPPLGDFTIADAQALPDHFLYNGGFSAREQVLMNDDEVDAHYQHFFAQMEGFDRFIFAAACQTTVTTSWDRIQRVVALCRRYRGRPDGDRRFVGKSAITP
jgi:hypothetical protein